VFDQTYSPDNLRRITEIENRRGKNESLEFFPSVGAATDHLKRCISDAKRFRATHRSPYNAREQAQFDRLREAREHARDKRDDELLKCLTGVSERISRPDFRLKIQKRDGPKGKPVYVVTKGSAECYYAIKQISRNISRIYKVKQSNKDRVISQLCDHLNDGFPYHILKIDVQNFYESIDHHDLIEKLRSDQLLSMTSIRMIEHLLWDYANLASTPSCGLPRGVGISAYLAELYMREFDIRVSSHPEVMYYARYVDDIVVLFSPTKASVINNYKKIIVDELNRKKLSLNINKTFESPSVKTNWHFTYLGYKFKYRNDTNCKILLSDERFDKYTSRLRASFVRYNRQRSKNSKKAYRLLIKRIQYLTSNTQLINNKRNAFVGIYFSSPNLSDLSQLDALDGRLQGYIGQLTHSTSLQRTLANYSFKKGYEERIFRRFHRPGEFAEITRAWKYDQ